MNDKHLNNLWHSVAMGILAGLMISFGGYAFLCCPNKIVGAFLFCVGLLSIYLIDGWLYTGKLCYVLDNDKHYFLCVFGCLVGNYFGAGFGGIFLNSVSSAECVNKAVLLCEAKITASHPILFLKAVFCGIMIYLAVDSYNKTKDKLMTLICVPIFILCGFEHSIADMFYFFFANKFSYKAVIPIAIIIIGNFIGGNLIPIAKMKKI